MSAVKQEGWYLRKFYSHFDMPLSFEVAKAYITNTENVASHQFLPFLSYDIERRRINKTPKSRPIKYAAHVDGYIFSFYANELAAKYERLIQTHGLDKPVLAYRSGRGNNISFAKESFDFIKNQGTCVALGFDISGFFDNIDHSTLKEQWAVVLGSEKLPADHYAVFRAMTKHSSVDREKCFDALKYSIERRKQPGRICPIRKFRSEIKGRGLLETNRLHYGIPQGSALSAVLSNIYMYPFDLKMQALATELGGIYRRYCDDILFVAPLDREEFIKDSIRSELAAIGDQLQIQDDKTISAHFVLNIDNEIVLRDTDQPFQYLGFTFDGEKILLRSQTLSKFWRRAVMAVRKARRDSRKASRKGRNGDLFRRKIYRRFSHLGQSNFLTYAKRAAKHINPENYKDTSSWKQVSNHWNTLDRLIKENEGNFR